MWAVVPAITSSFVNLRNPYFKLFLRYIKNVKAIIGNRLNLKNNKYK